jgi:hypothetical protein
VVEHDETELIRETGRNQAPKILIASEPVGQHHRRPRLDTGKRHVVPCEHVHAVILPRRHADARSMLGNGSDG